MKIETESTKIKPSKSEILWFIFSFLNFYLALIIFSRIINSPFGIMSLVGYEFSLFGLYGFYKFAKLAEKRIKIRPKKTETKFERRS